jgi:hypothetical protein
LGFSGFLTESRHRSGRKQLGDAHKIVGGSRQGELPADPRGAAMACLAQAAYGFHPAKSFLDTFADALADRVTGMARGAAIDG